MCKHPSTLFHGETGIGVGMDCQPEIGTHSLFLHRVVDYHNSKRCQFILSSSLLDPLEHEPRVTENSHSLCQMTTDIFLNITAKSDRKRLEDEEEEEERDEKEEEEEEGEQGRGRREGVLKTRPASRPDYTATCRATLFVQEH